MRSFEFPEPELVRIFQSEEGLMMADDPHLGRLDLESLHGGLINTEWRQSGKRS